MKKIALLIAIALVISVGGVYATWSYSTLDVETFTNPISDKLSITTINTVDSTKGILSAPNSLALTIDDDNGDHKPDWDADIASSAGILTVKFTPNTGASPTKFKYYITLDNYKFTCTEHGEVSIFNPTDADDSVAGMQILSGELDFTGGRDAVSVDYTAAQIQEKLNLNTTITLDSIQEYNTYSEAVGYVTLVLNIVEITTP